MTEPNMDGGARISTPDIDAWIEKLFKCEFLPESFLY